jgi:hypothetical protein
MAFLLDDEEELDFEPGQVVSKQMICQGPPRCNLRGEDVHNEQLDGCKWCEVLLIDAMGRETFTCPGEA